MPTVSHTHVFPTAFGSCGVAWSARGICAVELPQASEDRLAERLLPHGEPASVAPAGVQQAISRMQRHLEGEPDGFAGITLDLRACSPFARKAYTAARRVKPGRTISYAGLAQKCGSPGGARAAGQAMATNPVPLVVPCHRVMAADGGLGGFSAHGGISTKLRLLSMEGADLGPVVRAGTRWLAREDPGMAPIIRRAGRFLLYDHRRGDPFTALAESIVHQQVSMKAGTTIFGRLLALAGKGSVLSPERVIKAGQEALKDAGLSRQKQSYMLDLARQTSEGTLELGRLERMDDEPIIRLLTNVKGIGRWSAQMYLMFRLGRLDVLPVDDLGLRKGVQQLLDLQELPSPKQVHAAAEGWAPYRSIATWYLWRAGPRALRGAPVLASCGGSGVKQRRARDEAAARSLETGGL